MADVEPFVLDLLLSHQANSQKILQEVPEVSCEDELHFVVFR